jgi:hypothetical protein
MLIPVTGIVPLLHSSAIAVLYLCYSCAISKSMAVLSTEYDELRFTAIVQRDVQWLARGLRLRMNVAPSYKSSHLWRLFAKTPAPAIKRTHL